MTAHEAYEKAYIAQKRMPELEHIIMQDAEYVCCYARHVIKGRWPEAETVIMQNAYWSYIYARNILKERWLEAEPIIAKSRLMQYYIEHFFDEPVITKDQVDIIKWDRKKPPGYFAPASLFEQKTSLLDMVIE